MLSELFQMDKILGVCEKIWYFILVTLMFWVCNVPLLLFFLFVGVDQIRTCLPLFLACMAFLPPALSAVFYAMNRMVRGTYGKCRKDFWHGYRMDWGQKMRLSALQMLALLIFWTNVEFFAKQVPVFPLVILFALLFALVILITPNLYLLVSRYQMSNRELVKAAATLTIARPVNTLGNIAAIGIALMLFELQAGTAVLCMVGVYGFLVVFMGQKIMEELEMRSEG